MNCAFPAQRRALFCLVALVTSACSSIPPGRSAVDDVSIVGAKGVDEGDIKNKIATAASPKFLGVFRGVVYDYETLDRVVLQRDLARIERYYRARGYYDAQARVARVIHDGPKHVRVVIVVSEGQPVLVHSVRVDGLAGLPPKLAKEARGAATTRLRANRPFEEDAFSGAEWAVKRALTDAGYAYAQVTRDAAVDLVTHQVDVVFIVRPDRPATFGPIRIEGLGSLPESAIRRALDLQEGEPYSTRDLDSAQQAVLNLGVVSSVVITPELNEPPPEPRVVPVTVKIEPARLHSLTLGGGVEFDALKTDIHGVIGWQSKNFLGGLRSFDVSFKPGVVLYPLRVDNLVAPNRLLFEERLRLDLRQPGLVEARTTLFFRPEANIFPLLIKTQTDPNDPVLGYRELRVALGADRTYWKLFTAVSYSVQVENPFTYVGDLDPALGTVFIAYPELGTTLDLRDDRVRPHKGAYITNDVQVAGLGGAARDVKVQPEARGYVPLGRSLTLAGRTTVGFLLPFNYGSFVENDLGRPYTDVDRIDRVHDIQLVYFRGFFSGGPSSNRGYPLRTIAPHGVVPFLSPEIAAQQVARLCTVDNPEYDPARCSIPLGGFSLWEASLELRYDIAGPFSTAVFCDASDVAPKTAQIRLNYPHLSCGAGARYDTPVGPIRLDVGYRIPGLQHPADANPQIEGDPGTIFGIPIAVAFGIGEAF